MLSKDEVARVKTKLEKKLQEISHRFEENEHFGLTSAHYRESLGELSTYDNHPADEGTALYEREKDLALNEHMHEEEEGIKKALDAINNGRYGICEVCGKSIDKERLNILPTTTYCVEHTPDQKISHNPPVEEKILNFDLERRPESAQFDAEDSWQEVAKWGTSESPSDFIDVPDNYNDTYIESDENVGYVEDYENFVGVDIEGKNLTIYPNPQHEQYEDILDEEGIMSILGDLPEYEHEPYVDQRREHEERD